MELSEIIEAVNQTDPEAFKDALHKGSQKHFQVIFDLGHSTASKSFEPKKKEYGDQLAGLNQTIEDLKGQLTAKDDEMKELSQKSPDIETLKAKYEQKLIEKDQKHAEVLKTKEEQVSQLNQKWLNKEKGRIKQQLINELLGQHVDDWTAKHAVTDDVMSRILIGDDDTVKVYQADGSTPYMPPEGESPITLLAKEIVETLPADRVRPPKNNDSGYQNGRGNGKAIASNPNLKRSTMSASDAVKFIGEHGQEEFMKLPA